MKNILMFFVIFTSYWAQAQTGKPSGVFSLNGQQTVGNDDIYYATIEEYLAFLCDGVLPGGITSWNGAVVGGVKVSHERAFFESHVAELQLTAVSQISDQLIVINNDNAGKIFGANPTVAKYRGFIKSHMEIMDLQFILTGSDTVVWMLGEYGDFTKGKFVKHLKADGKYFVMKVNNKLYVIARVSCFNNVTLKETLWLQTGVAKLRNQPSDEGNRGEDYNDPTDPKKPNPSPKPRKVTVNGEEVADVTSAGGDINITLNGGNATATIGDINVKGGSSNNINNVTGGAQRTVNEPIQTPWGPATTYQRQSRYDVVDGVYHDRSAAYFASLPSSNPNYGVANNIANWLFGNGCNGYGYYNQCGQTYCVGGNWNNNQFQPNWNQCYQYGNGGWGLNIGFNFGTARNATFCGGYNGPTWVAPSHQGWNTAPRGAVNNYYTNHTIPPVSGPRMGPTIGAGNNTGGGNNPGGGPHMGYTHR
ncbi:MAG: hypothetical protein WCG20_02355 [bacterium]